jgi:D-threo-aldose 1-dehydrogenase
VVVDWSFSKGRHEVSTIRLPMPDLNARVRVGKTSLAVPRIGIGTAPLGNMFEALSDEQADAVLASAVGHGLRYFDTAPLYGHGLAEQRVGRAVAPLSRDEVFVSTKVGRLLQADAPRDESQFYQGEPFYKDVPAVGPVWDFTYDGIMRSVEESFQRTGLNRFDVLLLHDPDDHFDAASTSGYRALAKLREEGTVRAIGAGMNQAPMLARLVEACDLDVLLVAGRYTLLDQVAMDELLPLCEQRTVSIVVGGVFNSGILIDPAPGARYNYVPADAAVLARAQKIKAVCDRYSVPLPAAALQFPLAHPRVCTVLLGIRAIDELEKNLRWLEVSIPDALWADLKREGLLRDNAPTPSSAKGESRH